MDDTRQQAPGRPGVPDWLSIKDTALEMAAEGVAISDARQSDNPLVYCNAGFERLTGYPRDEVLGRNCRFLQGPETDPSTLAQIRETLSKGKECRVELLNYRKDGTTFWNRLAMAPIRDSNGAVTHFIAVQSDISELRRTVDDLKEKTRQLRRANMHMSQDLDAAACVQRALLPDKAPDVEGLHMAWVFEPCDELAGDILDVYRLNSHQVGLYLLDVAGHGVTAALHAVTLHRLLSPAIGQLRSMGTQSSGVAMPSPADVAGSLNAMFPFDGRTGQFFTMVYGVLDVSSRAFHYVSAGHPPVIHVPGVGAVRALEVAGFPIGVVDDASYEEFTVPLAPGDRLYLYSDGVLEATDAEGTPFGRERLLQSVECARALPLEDSLRTLQSTFSDFCDGTDAEDDVSILACELLP